MNFTHAFAQLDDRFYEAIAPTPVQEPELLLWNEPLAEALGIEENPAEHGPLLAAVFAGNQLPQGARPIALAYAGHQFGHFVPQLGDGRAHLLGELIDRDGELRDIQLKGSGPTRFSRGGDGRCALGPAVREYIMSEAMHALGVPTTRCLAVVATGEAVFREKPLPGAIVTRVASSHLRVGTLQYFAARGQDDAVQALCEHAIERHDPDLEEQGPERYLAFLDRVIERQVRLVVEWMRVGFIHGVMNTDNTALSGETIDYGPCAMMGRYDPQTVFSSIDTRGRYAFGNQPHIAQWNMTRLAECLIPLIDDDTERAVDRLTPRITSFDERFHARWLAMMGRKLGLVASRDEDESLIRDLLQIMLQQTLDYTLTFQQLAEALTQDHAGDLDDPLQGWVDRWRQRLAEQDGGEGAALEIMSRNNPLVIPRNHHVEAVLAQCLDRRSAAGVETFLRVLRSPYAVTPDTTRYQDPAPDADRDYQTFCGT